MPCFILVHGAFHGAWCWRPVAELLRARGHRVAAPTMPGLGERRAEPHAAVTLRDFGRALTDHLFFEDVSDAILVGHSFGGAPIAFAAEHAPDRIRGLIWLDALIPAPDGTPFDWFGPEIAAARRAQAAAAGVPSIPAPPPEAFGVTDPAQAAWLAPRLTPHPLGAYETAAGLSRPAGAGLPSSYIRCTAPIYPGLVWAHAKAAEAGWPVHDLAAGHDCMITHPVETADLLEALAGGMPQPQA